MGHYTTPLSHGRSTPKIPVSVLPDNLPTPLSWITTDVFGEAAYQKEASGRKGALQNPVEAELVVEMIRMWDAHEPFRQWVETQTEHIHVIGIICSYSAQAELIRLKLRSAFISDSMRQSIKIDTVDSYQGKENPIVVLSLVRNNPDGPMEDGLPTIKPGFMARQNRINVAVSRAMDRLVIVGARARWRSQSPMAKVAAAFEKQVEGGVAKVTDGAQFRGLIEASRLSKKKKDQKKRPVDFQESTT
ncbi:C-terminal helicase domain-containing protein [Hydrocarboniphaga effusa]|uniref:C-terminal helicase domain-containing protein n=1 Tax=Hydrocarboniphaga effusa TaxID=243629 RepID=UPI00398BE07B